jgi:hypothetical protein
MEMPLLLLLWLLGIIYAIILIVIPFYIIAVAHNTRDSVEKLEKILDLLQKELRLTEGIEAEKGQKKDDGVWFEP